MKFGVGNVLGECEPGQVKLKNEEFLRKCSQGWMRLDEIQVKIAAWKLYFLLPIFSHLLEKRQSGEKSANCRRLGGYKKNRAWKNSVSFGWKKNIKPESVEEKFGSLNLEPVQVWGRPGSSRGGWSWISKCSSAPCWQFWFCALPTAGGKGAQGHLQLQEKINLSSIFVLR